MSASTNINNLANVYVSRLKWFSLINCNWCVSLDIAILALIMSQSVDDICLKKGAICLVHFEQT